VQEMRSIRDVGNQAAESQTDGAQLPFIVFLWFSFETGCIEKDRRLLAECTVLADIRNVHNGAEIHSS